MPPTARSRFAPTRTPRRWIRISAPLLLVLGAAGCADLERLDLDRILVAGGPLDEATVASGLRQALEVGAERTTSELSVPGAFSEASPFRLHLPEDLEPLAHTLRVIGLSSQVDALEDSMNRAAEEAVGQALPIFLSAIAAMSISDAFAILNGPEDAATTYFRERTSDALGERFTPIAESAMRDVGLYAIYEELVARYETIPFATPPAVDLERYVADRTLSVLFMEIAREEARIRREPAARSTALLRRVFAGGASTPETEAR